MLKVRPGLDVFLEQKLDLVRGKRVGLVTNHSAVNRNVVHILDILPSAGVKLTALFAPEHGIRGDAPDGQAVQSGTDPRTGIPVFSLYGPNRKPTPEMLHGLDTLLFDIQDIGCRFYTYIYTMSYALQACAENRKQVIVLDRPNPINGLTVEGNIPDKQFASFVGLHPVPIRHGLTIGEMAMLFNDQFGISADLHVVPCHGWKRAMWFDETGLAWVMPSPNMPTPETALLYPGICLIEGTNVSEGRGTTKPFEIVGAPWVDGYKLATRLNASELPGLRFRPVHFIPTASKFAQQACTGVQAHIMDRNAVRSVETGLHILKALLELHPTEFQFRPAGQSGKYFFDLLAGTDKVRLSLTAGASVHEITELWREDLGSYLYARQRFWLYS